MTRDYDLCGLRRAVMARLPVPRTSCGTYLFTGGVIRENGSTEVHVELDDGRKAFLLLCAAGFDRWEV